METVAVCCTACGEVVNHGSARTHPVLNILMCKVCHRQFKRTKFVAEDGENQDTCQLCASERTDAQLVCCDSCPFVFCTCCIHLNLGFVGLQKVVASDVWSCFSCEPQAIAPLQELCAVTLGQKKGKARKRRRQDVSEDSLSDSCEQCSPALKRERKPEPMARAAAAAALETAETTANSVSVATVQEAAGTNSIGHGSGDLQTKAVIIRPQIFYSTSHSDSDGIAVVENTQRHKQRTNHGRSNNLLATSNDDDDDDGDDDVAAKAPSDADDDGMNAASPAPADQRNQTPEVDSTVRKSESDADVGQNVCSEDAADTMPNKTRVSRWGLRRRKRRKLKVKKAGASSSSVGSQRSDVEPPDQTALQPVSEREEVPERDVCRASDDSEPGDVAAQRHAHQQPDVEDPPEDSARSSSEHSVSREKVSSVRSARRRRHQQKAKHQQAGSRTRSPMREDGDSGPHLDGDMSPEMAASPAPVPQSDHDSPAEVDVAVPTVKKEIKDTDSEGTGRGVATTVNGAGDTRLSPTACRRRFSRRRRQPSNGVAEGLESSPTVSSGGGAGCPGNRSSGPKKDSVFILIDSSDKSSASANNTDANVEDTQRSDAPEFSQEASPDSPIVYSPSPSPGHHSGDSPAAGSPVADRASVLPRKASTSSLSAMEDCRPGGGAGISRDARKTSRSSTEELSSDFEVQLRKLSPRKPADPPLSQGAWSSSAEKVCDEDASETRHSSPAAPALNTPPAGRKRKQATPRKRTEDALHQQGSPRPQQKAKPGRKRRTFFMTSSESELSDLSDSDKSGQDEGNNSSNDSAGFQASPSRRLLESSDEFSDTGAEAEEESPLSLSSSSDDDTPLSMRTRSTAAQRKGTKAKGRSSGTRGPHVLKEDAPSKKKKKKQKVVVLSSSSSSDDDAKDSNDDSSVDNSQTRRKLRRIIDEDRLKASTRNAVKEEEDRRRRVKQQAILIDDACEGKKSIVLEVDAETKEPVIQVSDYFTACLKPHQVEGVRFLYNACVETYKNIDSEKAWGNGAVLAHCMGLGKTLQAIAFMDVLMCGRYNDLFKVKSIMVVAPASTLHNWEMEFKKWIPEDDLPQIYNYAEFGKRQLGSRVEWLDEWHNGGGILIINYEAMRVLLQNKQSKKYKKRLEMFLTDPGPDVIICDEGHLLRNVSSQISKTMALMKCHCRVVLTGTPLQNNLKEYFAMMDFVKPNLLGTMREFTNRFVNPIANGQCADSTQTDVNRMKRQSHVLNRLLEATVHRRDFSALLPYLPPKHEFIFSVRLSAVQVKLYRKYLSVFVEGKNTTATIARAVLEAFHDLMSIVTHPKVLFERSEKRRAKREAREEAEQMKNFVADTDEEEGSVSEDASGQEIDTLLRENAKKAAVAEAARSAAAIAVSAPSPSTATSTIKSDWFKGTVLEDECGILELSGKLAILFRVLQLAEKVGDKVLVFSQSLFSLDLIEHFLGQPEYGDWVRCLDYFRLDGSVKLADRENYATRFNKPSNKRLRLMLISTRAGGLGINLQAANRVIVFDVSWNPSNDTQSLFRVLRFGQTKSVFVYRLVAQGTMEEKIYDRQVTKQSLSLRVVDEQQIQRHFTFDQIQRLFDFDPDLLPEDREALGDSEDDKSTASAMTASSHVDRTDGGNEKTLAELPEVEEKDVKDPILTILLEEMKPSWLVRVHNHNSLLEDQPDDHLTEAEKQEAWEWYQKEKETGEEQLRALRSLSSQMNPDLGASKLEPQQQQRMHQLMQQHGLLQANPRPGVPRWMNPHVADPRAVLPHMAQQVMRPAFSAQQEAEERDRRLKLLETRIRTLLDFRIKVLPAMYQAKLAEVLPLCLQNGDINAGYGQFVRALELFEQQWLVQKASLALAASQEPGHGNEKPTADGQKQQFRQAALPLMELPKRQGQPAVASSTSVSLQPVQTGMRQPVASVVSSTRQPVAYATSGTQQPMQTSVQQPATSAISTTRQPVETNTGMNVPDFAPSSTLYSSLQLPPQ
ncbi:transcriptional regulator ATRX homolog [Sycon ciliatum]|uniref:transcriptional regulator ATRX homolog n=1 Tax=Sycon ciliatum TaxID=27933 RepID=UPI0031F6843D